jgi:hypothetical protein
MRKETKHNFIINNMMKYGNVVRMDIKKQKELKINEECVVCRNE